MPRYARINQSNEVETLRVYASKPDDLPQKGWVWLECPVVAQPSFNPLTEKITGPVYTIGQSEVTEEWTKVSLTAQEITDSKASAVASINGKWSPILKIFYVIDQRLRVLEGANAITFAQFKNGLAAAL